MKHLRTDKGDGNGNPAGLFMSWPAVATVLTLIPMGVGAAGFVRSLDLKRVDENFAFLSAAIVERKQDIKELNVKLDAIKTAQEAQNAALLANQRDILDALRGR